jgi:hypothetical protein
MSRPARRRIRLLATVGTAFKGDLAVRDPGEELLFAFGNEFKLRQADQIAGTVSRKLISSLTVRNLLEGACSCLSGSG